MPDSAIEVILAITISAGIFMLIAMAALRCQIAHSIGEDDGLANASSQDHEFNPLEAHFYRMGRRKGRLLYQKIQQQKENKA